MMFTFLSEYFDPFLPILRTSLADRCHYSSEPFGQRARKPFKFLASGPWIHQVSGRCQCVPKLHKALMTVDANGRTSGTPAMKASQAYPVALGKALVNAWGTAGPVPAAVNVSNAVPAVPASRSPGAPMTQSSGTQASRSSSAQASRSSSAQASRSPIATVAHQPGEEDFTGAWPWPEEESATAVNASNAVPTAPASWSPGVSVTQSSSAQASWSSSAQASQSLIATVAQQPDEEDFTGAGPWLEKESAADADSSPGPWSDRDDAW